MQHQTNGDFPQYSFGEILLIWALAAVPMGILGWIAAPALSRGAADPGMVRLGVLTIGLIWQFVLVLYMIRRELGTLQPSAVMQRLWLNKPRSPKTGAPQASLWWWVIPLVILTALYQMQVVGFIERLWLSIFPGLAEPAGFSMGAVIDSPEGKARMLGAWGFFILFIVNAVFNTFIGEELLFRGLLLPRMQGAFGRWDWLANGLLFGLYHLHQPWGILGSVIDGALFYAFPTKKFRSAWFGIISHSGQSLFFAFLILGLVLGLA